MNTSPEASRAPRAPLWMLIVLFFAPLAVAFALYYTAWRPVGFTNQGELINPPRALTPPQLASLEGRVLDSGFLRGKWSLVYVGPGDCDARCRQALTLMRQTRLALNDDLARVHRVFFATGACCDRAYLETEHRGLVVVRAEAPAAGAFLREFPEPEGGRIYIVDPLGNLMMSYRAGAPGRDLLEDLKKLLKLSRIG